MPIMLLISPSDIINEEEYELDSDLYIEPDNDCDSICYYIQTHESEYEYNYVYEYNNDIMNIGQYYNINITNFNENCSNAIGKLINIEQHPFDGLYNIYTFVDIIAYVNIFGNSFYIHERKVASWKTYIYDIDIHNKIHYTPIEPYAEALIIALTHIIGNNLDIESIELIVYYLKPDPSYYGINNPINTPYFVPLW